MAEMVPQKRDKIFDNTFEDQDFKLDSTISFQISPQYSDDRDEEDKIQLEMIRRDIHALIINSRFKSFNDLGDLAESKKLKKIDINEKIKIDNSHGLGPFILAALEVEK